MALSLGSALVIYIHIGQFNLYNLIQVHKSNIGIWIMYSFPFLFVIWGQFSKRASSQNGSLQSRSYFIPKISDEPLYHPFYDTLTNLPNRIFLTEHIKEAILEANKNQTQLALVMIHIKQFNEITYSLGWQNGEDVLIEITGRLKKAVRFPNIVARIGNDVFCILLPCIQKESEATALSLNIHEALQAKYRINNIYLNLEGTIGISIFPHHGDNPDALLQHAAIAMESSKSKNLETPYAIYAPKMDKGLEMNLSLKGDLPYAITQKELTLHFQPLVDLKTHDIIGSEALVRWQHPRYGLIQPELFIEIAESSDQIRKLTRWVFQEAIKHCVKWHRSGHRIHIAINLSPHDITDSMLPNALADILKKYPLNPEFITLELTESAILVNETTTIQVLKELSRMHFKIAIDDFGTGYSSLIYLSKLPVKKLKIDKSFIISMNDTPNNAIIIKAIIDLAHQLGLKIVAEGIENQAIYNNLIQLGCDIGQGFYISQPMPPENFTKFIQNRKLENSQTRETTKSSNIPVPLKN